MTRVADLDTFNKWVRHANPLDRFTYYIGFGLTDSLLATNVRKHVYKSAIVGEIYLVQKRDREYPGHFEFIAIRASKPPVYKLLPFSDERVRQKYRQLGRAM